MYKQTVLNLSGFLSFFPTDMLLSFILGKETMKLLFALFLNDLATFLCDKSCDGVNFKFKYVLVIVWFVCLYWKIIHGLW